MFFVSNWRYWGLLFDDDGKYYFEPTIGRLFLLFVNSNFVENVMFGNYEWYVIKWMLLMSTSVNDGKLGVWHDWCACVGMICYVYVIIRLMYVICMWWMHDCIGEYVCIIRVSWCAFLCCGVLDESVVKSYADMRLKRWFQKIVCSGGVVAIGLYARWSCSNL